MVKCCHCIHRWYNASDQAYYTQLLLIAMLTTNFVRRVPIVFVLLWFSKVRSWLQDECNNIRNRLLVFYNPTNASWLDSDSFWIAIVASTLCFGHCLCLVDRESHESSASEKEEEYKTAYSLSFCLICLKRNNLKRLQVCVCVI